MQTPPPGVFVGTARAAAIRIFAIFALLLSLWGCDGHLVLLNIRERQTVDEKAHRHTVYICGGQNAVDLVQGVAKSLSLIEESASTEAVSQNKYEWRSPDASFRLSLQSQKDGAWQVMLMDWPEPMQSELSKQAEVEIRQGAKTDCSRK